VEKVSHADKNANADAVWAEIQSNLAKPIIRVYKNKVNGVHFEHLV